jgi:hypothetical protein
MPIHRSGFARLLLVAFVFPLLSSCGSLSITRYKVTITIFNGETAVQASGVQQFTYTGPSPIFPSANGECGAEGEAIPLRVSDGRFLIATMSNRSNCCWDGRYGATLANSGLIGQAFDSADSPTKGRSWEVQPENYPLFITFDDRNDPNSVVEVDPVDLAATFGKDWRFGFMTVEKVGVQNTPELNWGTIVSALWAVGTFKPDKYGVVSDDAVTIGRIDVFLPWLKDPDGGASLWGELISNKRDMVAAQIERANLISIRRVVD